MSLGLEVISPPTDLAGQPACSCRQDYFKIEAIKILTDMWTRPECCDEQLNDPTRHCLTKLVNIEVEKVNVVFHRCCMSLNFRQLKLKQIWLFLFIYLFFQLK